MSSIIKLIRGETDAESVAGNGQDDEDNTGFDTTTSPFEDRIILTHAPLDEKEALTYVRDDGAGATCLFVGTTRDEFQGKAVERLLYHAYTALARKMMTKLVNGVRPTSSEERVMAKGGVTNGHTTELSADEAKQHEIKRIYLAHRLGDVAVGEPSILVCVSSGHRRAAFEACSSILEEVKRQVPIWKKEVYAGAHAGTSEWKANAA